jgi:hypothetical protein
LVFKYVKISEVIKSREEKLEKSEIDIIIRQAGESIVQEEV